MAISRRPVDAINEIRKRAVMPEITSNDPAELLGTDPKRKDPGAGR